MYMKKSSLEEREESDHPGKDDNEYDEMDEEERILTEGRDDSIHGIFGQLKKLSNSKVSQHQKACALLEAVEEIMAMQGLVQGETAYFAALMSVLEQYYKENEVESDQETKAAVMLLLGIIFPKIAKDVIRAKWHECAVLFMMALEKDVENTALVKSTLGCLSLLLNLVEANQWSQPNVLKMYQRMLSFVLDPRPKIRRKAQEAVDRIISQPPTPFTNHPATHFTAKYILNVWNHCKKQDYTSASYALSLCKIILKYFQKADLEAICDKMVGLTTHGSPMILMSMFQTFHSYFEELPIQLSSTSLMKLLEALSHLKPNKNDSNVAMGWISMISAGFIALSHVDAIICGKRIPNLFASMMTMLTSEKKEVCLACVQAMEKLIQNCITSEMINMALKASVIPMDDRTVQSKTSLETIISNILIGLGYKYHHVWNLVLNMITILFEHLKSSSYPLLKPALEALGDLFNTKEFPYKDGLASVFAAAIRVIGPRQFLSVLPLNLENDHKDEFIPRPWLLPILKDNINNTELAYFIEIIYPLANRIKEKATSFEEMGRGIETRAYQTLYLQLWSMFPSFCNFPVDLKTTFPQFAKELGLIINSEPKIRQFCSHGLEKLIVDNVNLSQETADHVLISSISKYDAEKNVEMLASFSKNFLPLLFNVYITSTNQDRTYLLLLIEKYFRISDSSLTMTYFKMIVKKILEISVLKKNDGIENEIEQQAQKHALLDLTIAMISQLNKDALLLFYKMIKSHLQDSDATAQKKAYKGLSILLDTDRFNEVFDDLFEDIQKTLLDYLPTLAAASKKHRIKCLLSVVQKLKEETLDFIPSIIPEVILTTKEPGEKARYAAYDLLMEMGSKMMQGGLLAIDNESNVKMEASIDEYFKMVIAGLAGTTPHMISATVLSLARLIFEYKDLVDPVYIEQMIRNNFILLESTNREIIKSAIGFVKVIVVALSAEQLRPYLTELIGNLLRWSSEHHSHFKEKVRHIFERLLRKYTIQEIQNLVPLEHKKFFDNIRKRKERAKKKKSNGHITLEMNENTQKISQLPSKQSKKNHADYDDALYGEDGELESNYSTDEIPQQLKEQLLMTKNHLHEGTWLKSDHPDNPIDLLDPRAISNFVSTNPRSLKRFRDQADVASEDSFEYTADGRLIINNDDEDSLSFIPSKLPNNNNHSSIKVNDPSITLPITSRNEPRSLLSHSKSELRKRLRTGYDDDDEDIKVGQHDDDFLQKQCFKTQKTVVSRVPYFQKSLGKKPSHSSSFPIKNTGKEYRSKKAGGDILRPGKPIPFAYVPLRASHSQTLRQSGLQVGRTRTIKRRTLPSPTS